MCAERRPPKARMVVSKTLTFSSMSKSSKSLYLNNNIALFRCGKTGLFIHQPMQITSTQSSSNLSLFHSSRSFHYSSCHLMSSHVISSNSFLFRFAYSNRTTPSTNSSSNPSTCKVSSVSSNVIYGISDWGKRARLHVSGSNCGAGKA